MPMCFAHELPECHGAEEGGDRLKESHCASRDGSRVVLYACASVLLVGLRGARPMR